MERVLVTATLGPGHHGGELLQALRAESIDYRAISAWPDFSVEDWRGGESRSSVEPWYRWSRRLLWGTWRRLPVLGQSEAPRAADLWMYEVAAERRLSRCDLFVGWTQVSLRGIRRARAMGIPTLLEHPMTHVDEWIRILDEEYRRWGRGRSTFYSQFPRLLVSRMKREVEEADRISVLSTFARQTFLAAGVSSERLVELPLGVDVEAFAPGPRRPGPFNVLYVGRLELLKGIPYLLEAVEGMDLVTRLVGSRHAEVEPFLSRARLEVLPPLPRVELPRLYQSADVVVFPSVNDAFGLVILEAMACGVPVVATHRSGAPDVITDGVDGFVVPARDSGAIRDRIVQLRDPELRRRMGEAARAKILSRYTPKHYQHRVATLFRALAAGRARLQASPT